MTSTHRAQPEHRIHPLTIAAAVILAVGLAVAVILMLAPVGEGTDVEARRGLAFIIGLVSVIAAGALALIPGAGHRGE